MQFKNLLEPNPSPTAHPDEIAKNRDLYDQEQMIIERMNRIANHQVYPLAGIDSTQGMTYYEYLMAQITSGYASNQLLLYENMIEYATQRAYEIIRHLALNQ